MNKYILIYAHHHGPKVISFETSKNKNEILRDLRYLFEPVAKQTEKEDELKGFKINFFGHAIEITEEYFKHFVISLDTLDEFYLSKSSNLNA